MMSVGLKSSDIVKNLSSLDFEVGLAEVSNDPGLLPLRMKSYAHSITVCAQSVYIISLLNDVLEHAAKQSRAVPVNYVYRVGFIGCGRLGNLIIKCLLHYKIVKPHCILVSTRRPELLKEFSDTGVITCFNNGKVASSCPVMCICCLPSQLSVVAESLQGYLSPSTLVYSIVGGVTLQRHCQLLHTNSVLRPSFSWPNTGWTVDSINNYATQVTTLLQKQEVISLTCPQLPVDESDNSMVVQVFLATLNLLTSLGIGRELAVRITTFKMFKEDSYTSQIQEAMATDKLLSTERLQLPLLPLNKNMYNLQKVVCSEDVYGSFMEQFKRMMSIETKLSDHSM
ncbi:NADP-dependent oxidoreductase domain-containing protein 1-like [Dysidea avara]|uniref:NADP-dependent oxidoreductase domain-containing protein 1-like n=1 Tax=Dysidea avara TaxID=196820 RepID=UPI00331930E2